MGSVTLQRSGHWGQEEAALRGWSAGRRNAPSRPHEERRERGDIMKKTAFRIMALGGGLIATLLAGGAWVRG